MLVCIDRYALCSARASIRAFSQPKTAYRAIFAVTLFWYVASVHLLILEDIQNGRCNVYGLYGQIMGIYALICTGIIPITLMTVCSVLLLRNLRQLRSRVVPDNTTVTLRKRDASLMKLVLVEVAVYIACTIGHPSITIYNQATADIAASKSVDRKQIESFVNFIAMSFLLYLNWNTTFYVHLATSQTFRKEVIRFLRSSFGKLFGCRSNTASRIATTANTQKRERQQQTGTIL